VKKLILAVALVGVLVGGTLGGAALAAKPIKPSSPAIATLGDYMVLDGSAVPDILSPEWITSPQHVQLTIGVGGHTSGALQVLALMGDGGTTGVWTVGTVFADGLYTYEFDAASWRITFAGLAGTLAYDAVVTYEP
jgi:hypothetical protein